MTAVATQPMRELKSWWRSIRGKLPPYYEVEGLLKAKEDRPDGMHYIVVNAAAVRVDRVTFSRLTVGDNLRVRYTRDASAISIDRMIPGGKMDVSEEGTSFGSK